jgi:hypothetical protein
VCLMPWLSTYGDENLRCVGAAHGGARATDVLLWAARRDNSVTNAHWTYSGHILLAGCSVAPDPTLEDIESKSRSGLNRILLRKSAPPEAFQVSDSLGNLHTWRSHTIAEKINWIESIKTLSGELQAPPGAARLRARSLSPAARRPSATGSASGTPGANRQLSNSAVTDEPISARAGRRAQRAAGPPVLDDASALHVMSASPPPGARPITSGSASGSTPPPTASSPLLKPRLRADQLHASVRSGDIKQLKSILKVQKKTGDREAELVALDKDGGMTVRRRSVVSARFDRARSCAVVGRSCAQQQRQSTPAVARARCIACRSVESARVRARVVVCALTR